MKNNPKPPIQISPKQATWGAIAVFTFLVFLTTSFVWGISVGENSGDDKTATVEATTTTSNLDPAPPEITRNFPSRTTQSQLEPVVVPPKESPPSTDQICYLEDRYQSCPEWARVPNEVWVEYEQLYRDQYGLTGSLGPYAFEVLGSLEPILDRLDFDPKIDNLACSDTGRFGFYGQVLAGAGRDLTSIGQRLPETPNIVSGEVVAIENVQVKIEARINEIQTAINRFTTRCG